MLSDSSKLLELSKSLDASEPSEPPSETESRRSLLSEESEKMVDNISLVSEEPGWIVDDESLAVIHSLVA